MRIDVATGILLLAALLASFSGTASGRGSTPEHDPGATGPQAARGRALASELGCGGCHGGMPEPETARERAPALGAGAPALSPDFVFAYLADPGRRRDDIGATRMPDFRLDEGERAALALHLGTGTPSGALAGALDSDPELDAELGGRIYGALGCAGCHGAGGGVGPDLSGEGGRVTEAWLRGFLADPRPVRPEGHPAAPGSRMPDFRLTNAEGDALAAYLLALRGDGAEGGPAPSAAVLEPPTAFQARRTERLVRDRMACLGCHELGGEGGALGPSLDGLAERLQPAYVLSVIRTPGIAAPASGMPRQPLTLRQVRRVASWLLDRGGERRAPRRISLADPDHPLHAAVPRGPSEGAELYARHCAACHGPEGRGNGWNQPNLPVRPTVHASAELMVLRPDDTLFDGIHAGAFVLDGSPRMPAFGEMLSADQIRALVGYIRVLCDCAGPAWARDGGGGR